ncbi:hypothetical protein Q7P37_010780 [Cladosporium fusiforme]
MANPKEMGSLQAEIDPLSDPEERRVLFAALDSFRQYRQAAHYNITHVRRQAFYSLPSAHVDILSEPPFSLPQTFRDVDDAIDCNADIAEAILKAGLALYGIDPNDDSWKGTATPRDMDKARSTIRQLYRDWSNDGHHELQAVFAPIQDFLEEHLPLELGLKGYEGRHSRNILVPGAGLGRLVFDLTAQGYSVEGNEISYHQLIASNYILNCTQGAGQHTLYPWALSFSNHLNRANQLRGVQIPDMNLEETLEASSAMSELHYSQRMNMSSGDFCVLYRSPDHRNSFHAVATCFFIDTAPNVINYIETIKNCLVPGGFWVNAGPLLWHFESEPTPAEKEKAKTNSHTSEPSDLESSNRGIGDPGSFELTNDEVIALVQRYGFEIVKHDERSKTQAGYILDDHSMLTNYYRPSFWVAKKIA